MTIQLGHVVPDFTCTATNNQTIRLSDLQGQQVVLYFYPKDATPGCTMEGKDFRDAFEAFSSTDTVIFGVSKDNLQAHEKFKRQHAFPFELIADTDQELCQLFDVIKEKSMFGKKYMGIERSTFLIDKAGKLIHEWRKVKVRGHVNAVLKQAQLLASETVS